MNDERLNDPRMDYYKEVFKNSIRWHTDGFRPFYDLKDKKVIVYGEQGFGDIIQFSRYISVLKERNCHIMFYVPKDLHRLFECLDVELLDKDNCDLPPHDFHVLSLDLPFMLEALNKEFKFPYLTVNETAKLDEVPSDVKRIGIVWEGSSNNSTNRDCPLKYFKCLDCPLTKLYVLQKEIRNPTLLEDVNFDVFGYDFKDFYDTATVINAMDAVVTIDTAVLHLAGAMNKLTFALLSHTRDPRWDIQSWYNSVVCIKQKRENDWDLAFNAVLKMMTGTMYQNAENSLLNQVLK